MEFYVSKEEVNRVSITNWYRTRRSIFILLCYESLLFGVELTVLEPTEYFYYKDVLGVRSPMVCYASSLALNVWSSLMASIFVSHVIKRYQMFTDTMLFLSLISILGHCLYFVTRIPAVTVIGRFVAGFGKATNIISTLYVQRLYPDDDLAHKMAILSNFVTIGTIIGPVLTYIFLQIDFSIGSLNLNFGNSPGFYMVLCKVVLFVGAFLFLDDIPYQDDRERFLYTPKNKIESVLCQCKAEEDVNENYIRQFDEEELFLQEKEEREDIIEEEPEELEEEPVKVKQKVPLRTALREILSGHKRLVVLAAVCLHGLTFKIINSLIPVESSRYLHWNIEKIAGLCLANAILGTVTSVLMAFFFTKSTHFLNLIGGMVFGVFSFVLMGTIPYYVINETAANLLFCFMSFFNVLSSCLIGLSARMILVHLTDQKFRSFTDVVRTCLLELSYFIGALLIMLVNLNLAASCYVGLAVTLILLVVIVLKLKQIWV